jgi:hypothetical protein
MNTLHKRKQQTKLFWPCYIEQLMSQVYKNKTIQTIRLVYKLHEYNKYVIKNKKTPANMKETGKYCPKYDLFLGLSSSR